MKETLVRALFFWLTLLIIIQPILSHIDYLRDLIVKANTSYIAQKAAVTGVVTADLRQEVIRNLSRVGFKESSINIEYTTDIKERSERLDVTIKVDRPPMMLYNFSGQSEPTYYYGHAYIMSEYLR